MTASRPYNPSHSYPWYGEVSGDEIEQGDLFIDCPVLHIPKSMAIPPGPSTPATIEYEHMDVAVLTQSCDMVKGREKVRWITLCPAPELSRFDDPLARNTSTLEEIRKGRLPALHMLNRCDLDGLKSEIRIVDFGEILSFPLNFLRAEALRKERRVRLLPPYREHLAQAFARFYMRVGLPSDIPPFK